MPVVSLSSPIGPLTVEERDGAIVALRFAEEPTGASTPLLESAAAQLAAYFAGKRTAFDLPLAPAGSPFQRRVWAAMADIPCGETRTYGDIARQLGSSPRAVGRACGENPIPVIVPCHRVVAANGAPGGYSGAGGVATKIALLDIEFRKTGLLLAHGKDVIHR